MKTKTQKHWFEKFYDFMSNFIFGGKRTVLALIILISLNIHGQKKNNDPRYYDYLGTDGSKGYVSVNYKTKDIQLVNIKDSIQAIKLLYKAYRQMSYEADMYRWELIKIEKSKTNLKQKKL